MAEYIERETASKVIKGKADVYEVGQGDALKGLYVADCEVSALPSADVAPVRHGQWGDAHLFPPGPVCKCLACGDYALMTASALCSKGKVNPRLNYCPNCGARMDLGAVKDAGKEG